MKKILLSIAFCFTFLSNNAQTTSVEKSIYGVQIGLLGVYGHNEYKLSNEIALRSEIGLDFGLWNNSFFNNSGFVLAPVLSLEPRWYYNFDKRVKKSRRIDGNSGNFFSIKISYHPDWFVISNHENLRIIEDISIIPTWGIRRNLGKHFNYEAGVGFGYIRYLDTSNIYESKKGETALNLHFRIGYRF